MFRYLLFKIQILAYRIRYLIFHGYYPSQCAFLSILDEDYQNEKSNRNQQNEQGRIGLDMTIS